MSSCSERTYMAKTIVVDFLLCMLPHTLSGQSCASVKQVKNWWILSSSTSGCWLREAMYLAQQSFPINRAAS